MKILCGTDIIEIQRIKESIDSLAESFKNRVYTEKEIQYCESKKNQKYQHYAARFAAKEAVFKAISELLKDKYDISWKNIEIYSDEKSKPYVRFIGIEFKQIANIDISLSHCKDYATAMVTVLVN